MSRLPVNEAQMDSHGLLSLSIILSLGPISIFFKTEVNMELFYIHLHMY